MKKCILFLASLASLPLCAQALPGVTGHAGCTASSVAVGRMRGYEPVDGAWTWFNDPRAVCFRQHIYIAAVDSRGRLKVVQYDPATDSTVVADLGFFQQDDHVNPALRITRDGHVEVYYAKHGAADYFRQRSCRAGDITAWCRAVNLDGQFGLDNYTYANLIELGDTVFNFFRATPADGGLYTLHMTKSADDGFTWTRPVRLLTGERPYFRLTGNGRDRIDIICNDGHPNKTANNSTYHFYYRGGWYRTDGSRLGSPPFTPARDLTRVYDGSGPEGKSWVWDVQVNGLGYPVCVFNTTGNERAHRYHYACWDGKRWKVSVLAGNAGTFLYDAEAQYSGGMAIDRDNTGIVYASVITDGQRRLWRYETRDDGATWEATRLTAEKAFRPFVIAGAPTGKRILYLTGTYNTYTDYDTRVKFVEDK
jgi:hypothetical protein